MMSKKKVLKKILIAFAVLIFLLVATISIAIWFVFTPEKLTPFVRKQAAKYITCKSEIGEVELTFFSTFPQFGLKVSGFALINPTTNAPSDTLVSTEQFIGVVDVGAWWKRDELVLTDLQLCNGIINAFVDSLGHANFDITPTDSIPAPPDTAKSEMPFRFINIKNVELNNIALSYIDKTQKLQAGIQNLIVKFSGSLNSDSLNMLMNVSDCNISFSYAGEEYLKNASIKMKIPAQVIMSKQYVKFDDSEVSLNNLGVGFKGTVENDTINKKILADISYQFNSWAIHDVIALVPLSYQSYLKGVKVDGLVSSKGEIKGAYSEKEMPLMNIQLSLQDGTLKYEGFPLPLSSMNGDFVFYSDLNNDALSYFRINQFSARTPQSSFGTSGMVTHLFSDIHCDLTSDANLVLSEFAPLIPASLKMKVKGGVSGQVKSAFSMSQVDKMLLDRMKISGSVALSNFDVLYDSIYMKTKYSTVDFSLPNPNTSSKNAKFLYTKVNSKDIDAGILDSYRAFMKNALISVETSDVMDTTRLPDVVCTYAIDSLAASMDTMKFSARKPSGNFTMLTKSKKDNDSQDKIVLEYSNDKMEASMGKSMSVRMNKAKLNADVVNFLASPAIKLAYSGNNLAMQMDTNAVRMDKAQMNAEVADYDTQPKIKFAYSSNNLDIQMGKSNSVRVNNIQMNTDIANDTTQKDIFLQWPVKGYLNMEKGVISMSSLTLPLEIPSIKMDFNPEVFNIKESKLKIDKSDFSLSGTLSNIKSYFKNDSLLRGSFNFVSDQTDVLQLMSLTSGIGNEKADSVTKPVAADSAAASGPYMVPKGIDITLRTNISKANFGSEIAKDISGEVRVKDGILVLDDLIFTTPASKMQLTAMYKTPRKNHLFVGFDYHMLNIQIESLLKMIPDLDSIMPMLRSFRGTGEFHIAVETYLDSMYNPKKSTIRGASSIKGQDLVLMDGETFTEIAKMLKFSKKAENKVDSLSAEFTVFKQEIDVYPFMLVMDKYKVVVAGRHNMDMSFNYNISLLESPLPLRICVEAKGTMDDLKVKPIKCKYRDLNRPTSRMLVQNKQLELRRIIRESLVKNVKKE